MAVRSVAAVKGVSLSRRHYPDRLPRDMAAFRAVLLLFLCRLPLASSCIPTVTPDDMYEDEMEATTSVLLTTVLAMTAETTSQATAEPTTTTSTTTTTTSTTMTTTTTTGMCPPSWVLNPANNFCYLVVPASSGTADDAKCDAQVAGATLASIHNADENAFLASLLDGTTTGYVFLGGHSPTGMLGTWYWTDGTMYGPYENWDAPGQPMAGPNCMVMTAAPGNVGKWFSAACNTGVYDLFCMIAAT